MGYIIRIQCDLVGMYIDTHIVGGFFGVIIIKICTRQIVELGLYRCNILNHVR